MKDSKILIASLLATGLALSGVGFAATPVTHQGVTTIHLDEHNGYFAARETLADLKAGEYLIEVTNNAGKVVGFWLQDARTREFLDRFPLNPGETRSARVTVSENGFRYRCPINPTPWYEVGVAQ